jgi:hypothetical protein
MEREDFLCVWQWQFAGGMEDEGTTGSRELDIAPEREDSEAEPLYRRACFG